MAEGKRGFEVVFVRHAKAGSRSAWQADDRLRPLTSAGRKQADGLVRQLRTARFERILSSPYVRCLETIQPLAHDRDLAVEPTELLAEATGLEAFNRLVDEVGVDALYCGHGDLLFELLEVFVDGGLIKPAQARLEKGCAWLLSRRKGGFRRARYLPPPS